jgi:subtilisin family serine protease
MAMIRTLLILFVALPTLLVAQIHMPATTRVGLTEIGALAARHSDAKELVRLTEGSHPTAYMHGRCMVGFLGRLAPGAVLEGVVPGPVQVGARIGDVVSFRIDAQQLDALYALTGITYVELAGKVKPDLDRLVKAVRADSVHRGINLPQAYTGEDVLIGITDWGFDYTHPMFYDTLLTTSRVRAAWDHYRQAGPAPAAYGYGSEFTTTEDLLAVQADTANIYSYATHGSHVAGIAGGGGAGLPYRGVAFGSQFLFCTFLVDAAAVLDAFAWMKAIADQDGKRLVMNMSWGLYHMGTLDGNSLVSQAIDTWSEEGVVFVNSGGNNGDVNFHIKRTFAGDTLRSRIQFYPYSAHPKMWGQSISMWGEPGQSITAGFLITNNSNNTLQETPWYSTTTQEAYLDSFMVQGTDTVYFNLTCDAAHPLNGRPHFRLRVKNRSSQLKIALKATAPAGVVHFWNVTELTNDVGNWGQTFSAAQTGWVNGDRNYGISEPACTESLLAVAAYTGEYTPPGGSPTGGAIATFSSYGPTLDERRKPDIAAPGVNVASSISSFTDNSYSSAGSLTFQGRSYPFARFSGTSMAAPAVTGIAALVLEADPTLSAADVKEILLTTARRDNFTGVIPPEGSVRWGQGKVNAYHAVIEALGLTGIDEQIGDVLTLWPNPATDQVFVQLRVPAADAWLELVDMTGRVLQQQRVPQGGTITLDLADLAPGMYGVQLQGSASGVLRCIKQ